MDPQLPIEKWPPKTPTRVSASAKERAIVRQRNRMTPLSSDLIERSPAGLRLREGASQNHIIMLSAPNLALLRMTFRERTVP
jgi:hypothetical protein